MGIIKGILKVGASAVLTVAGVASTALQDMSEKIGNDSAAGTFSAIKDASFGGIKSIWNIESQEKEYATEEEAAEATRKEEKRRLKAQALSCKELAQKATSEDMREKLMSRYEELMEQANSLSGEDM